MRLWIRSRRKVYIELEAGKCKRGRHCKFNSSYREPEITNTFVRFLEHWMTEHELFVQLCLMLPLLSMVMYIFFVEESPLYTFVEQTEEQNIAKI